MIATVFKVSVAVWKYYAYICIFYTIPHIGVILRTSDDNPLEYDFLTLLDRFMLSILHIQLQCSAVDVLRLQSGKNVINNIW